MISRTTPVIKQTAQTDKAQQWSEHTHTHTHTASNTATHACSSTTAIQPLLNPTTVYPRLTKLQFYNTSIIQTLRLGPASSDDQGCTLTNPCYKEQMYTHSIKQQTTLKLLLLYSNNKTGRRQGKRNNHAPSTRLFARQSLISPSQHNWFKTMELSFTNCMVLHVLALWVHPSLNAAHDY